MLAYAVEYTFGDRGAVARVATRPEQRVLVGAGAPPNVGRARRLGGSWTTTSRGGAYAHPSWRSGPAGSGSG